MTVIFPDPEKVVIAGLRTLLEGSSQPVAANTYIATKKPPSDLLPYPTKMVVVRSDGGAELDKVRLQVRMGFNVYATTYADANALATLVSAYIQDLPGGDIKAARVSLSPTRVDEDSQEERRFLTAEIIIKGQTL